MLATEVAIEAMAGVPHEPTCVRGDVARTGGCTCDRPYRQNAVLKYLLQREIARNRQFGDILGELSR